MTQFEIYGFILCLTVAVMLVGLFSVLLGSLFKVTVELIRSGKRDEAILADFERQQKKKKSRFFTVFSYALTAIVALLLTVAFAFSLTLNFTEMKFSGGIPSLKIVKSTSMATAHKENTYLAQNGLEERLQLFDLIVTKPLPTEEELKIYDIVVYEREGDLIIHRIVNIEEPNAKHPNERWFLLQGDASKYHDEFPVTYSMMRGFYDGVRIPFVGNFILFLQSPAGWVCIFLMLVTLVIVPLVERRFKREIEARLRGRGVPPPSVREKLPQVRLTAIPLSSTHVELRLHRKDPHMDFQCRQKRWMVKVEVEQREDGQE